ncbi:MAG: RecX family transcriptional regulator, partial [Clostridia bacterium]|nr:RecX family transcriptional regulator [Clostridia bacterium]
MKQITEIKKIGRGDRYKLFLDEEFFGTFEAEILARHCLKSGQEFDDDFFESLLIENGDYACFNRGLVALEKSMKTKKMMRDYLREKGYPKSCIDKACDKLSEYGYISDESFCENYILSYQNQKSKRKLKYDLLS